MIVVSDTSVLLNLCQIEQAELLRELFQEIVIPPEVAREFTRLASNVAKFKGLQMPLWIREQSPNRIPDKVRNAKGLDPGETDALSLAVELGADAVLIDERRAHQVAAQMGLKPIGILGILLQSKAAGLLNEVQPSLDRLQIDAGFWIDAELRKRILQLAGE